MRQVSVLLSVVVVVMLGSSILPSLPSATAQEATPPADCPATTPEENKELVRRWFAAVSEGSGEDVAALAADDIVYHDPSPQQDPETGGVAEWASERQQDYPDLQVSIEQLVAEDDLVASYHRFTGTQQGDLEEEQGVPATGVQSEWVAMVLFRIECGKVAEAWSLADHLGRLQRLGVISDEELRSVESVATPTP